VSRLPTLRDLRERAGITQAEAAANIGMDVDVIVEMETSDIDELGQDLDLYFEAIGFDPDDPDEQFFDVDEDDEDEEAAE
jgi:transcriptional regulator with XRE-family HTH domain